MSNCKSFPDKRQVTKAQKKYIYLKKNKAKREKKRKKRMNKILKIKKICFNILLYCFRKRSEEGGP